MTALAIGDVRVSGMWPLWRTVKQGQKCRSGLPLPANLVKTSAIHAWKTSLWSCECVSLGEMTARKNAQPKQKRLRIQLLVKII